VKVDVGFQEEGDSDILENIRNGGNREMGMMMETKTRKNFRCSEYWDSAKKISREKRERERR